MWAKQFSVRLFSPLCSVVTEIRHMPIPAHALPAVQFRLKSVCNEGHFTLETETVFHPYLPWYCSAVTETSLLAVPVCGLAAMQV
jgi:hypothetical protein